MNCLSKSNSSFIFIIPYNGEGALIDDSQNIFCKRNNIKELKSKKTNYCFYFNGYTNEKVNSPHPQKTNKIEWETKFPTFDEYKGRFKKVKNEILRGNSYLTNLTERIQLKTNLTLYEIYKHSTSPYKLWIENKLVCFSPETFINIENDVVSSFPMKGTIDGNIKNADFLLLNDEKEIAEHATIVDLIRNDLSIIANNVKVEKYRYIDVINTQKGPLLQTSSKITGNIIEKYKNKIGSILFTLLPAGSITGAPKNKTMEIIKNTENYKRDFYTGIMGIYCNRKLDSAVMIRYIDVENNKMYYKTGGGITSKSNAQDEYQEIIDKVYVPFY